jgi:hypothetical protein
MYDVIDKRCKLLLYISTKMDHLPMIKKKEQKMTMKVHLHTTKKKKNIVKEKIIYNVAYIIILHRLGL